MRKVDSLFSWVLLTVACSHGLPRTLPPTSPASERAEAAPLPVLGVALREDPPLPGAPADHWPGLGPAAPVAHHHHPGTDASAPMPPMPGM